MEQALPIDDYYWSREEVIVRMQSGEPAATAEEYLLRVRCVTAAPPMDACECAVRLHLKSSFTTFEKHAQSVLSLCLNTHLQMCIAMYSLKVRGGAAARDCDSNAAREHASRRAEQALLHAYTRACAAVQLRAAGR
jgi:hypothetical protein